MKSFVAIFLFASFIAGLRADDPMVEFLFDDGADGVDPTKHPYFVSISLSFIVIYSLQTTNNISVHFII